MHIEEAKVTLRKHFKEACEILEVDYSKISFVYDNIGERFKTTSNTCEAVGEILYINESWIKKVIKGNFLYDFQYQMYHEARHFYQGMIIADFHKRGKSKELPATIRQWEAEMLNYTRNEGTIETQKANAAQKMEIDANAFAIAMLYLKGITEARAPIEQWAETEKRVFEILKVIDHKYK